MEPIQVRRPYDGIAVASQVAVALIIGKDEDDVGVYRTLLLRCWD